MNYLFEVGHPASVHLFKNLINKLHEKGHKCYVVTADKDLSTKLLDLYNIEYTTIYDNKSSGLLNKSLMYLNGQKNMITNVKKFKPNFIISRGSLISGLLSKILRIPHITLSDSSHIIYFFLLPFIDAVFTPKYYRNDLGEKQIRFDGYKELAYLHPKYFKPEKQNIQKLGISNHEEYVILRFVSWKAYHDRSQYGFTLRKKIELVNKLNEYATVFITSEQSLPKQIEKYKININPNYIHEVLYFSKLFIGDSQTMTTESALLGTPAIRSNSYVGKNDMGNFLELQYKYKMIYNYKNLNNAIIKAEKIIQMSDIKLIWKNKLNKLLNDKINVTDLLYWVIKNYPDSIIKLKKDNEYQYNFK